MRFTDLAAEHAARLDSLAREPQWEALISSGAVDAARESMMVPSRPVNVFKLPVEQLQRINEPSVRALIDAGERNEDRLLDALGTWPEKWPADVPVRLSFVGVNLDFACDMSPRCIYCNQRSVERRMTPQHWLALVRSVIPEEGEGPYLFITGGEPLLEGEALWGPQGIIRAATAAGAACNVNTNGLRLTPEVALQLVSSGLSRLHVSLDSHLPEVQDAIYGCSGRWATVVRGIHNLQLAKRLLGAEHPVIHINCVLTRLNAPDFPGFLRFLLGMKLAASGPEARDFDLHLIPVGGTRTSTCACPPRSTSGSSPRRGTRRTLSGKSSRGTGRSPMTSAGRSTRRCPIEPSTGSGTAATCAHGLRRRPPVVRRRCRQPGAATWVRRRPSSCPTALSTGAGGMPPAGLNRSVMCWKPPSRRTSRGKSARCATCPERSASPAPERPRPSTSPWRTPCAS